MNRVSLIVLGVIIIMAVYRALKPRNTIDELIWVLSNGGKDDLELELQWEEGDVQMELKLKGEKDEKAKDK